MFYIHPFQANVSFLYTLKTSGFLMFSGGIEREHWPGNGLICLTRFYIIRRQSYSELYQTSKMEFFAKIVHKLRPLTIFAKNSILDL